MSLEEVEKPIGAWRTKWGDIVNIKFPRDQYRKLLEIKVSLGCGTWEEMADELYRLKPVLDKAHKVVKL